MRPALQTLHEARSAPHVAQQQFGLIPDDMTSVVRSFAQTFTVTEARGKHGQTARLHARTARHLTAHQTALCGENSDTPAGQRTVTRTQ